MKATRSKLGLVIATLLLVCALSAGVGTAGAQANGIFCYNIKLAAKGKSGYNCYSNWDNVREAGAWSYDALAWVWAYNQYGGGRSGSNECFYSGCPAVVNLGVAYHGYEENANQSSFSNTFYGEWFE